MAETWGFAIVGTVHAAADRWLEEPTISRETLAADLTDLLWSGARSVPHRRGGLRSCGRLVLLLLGTRL